MQITDALGGGGVTFTGANTYTGKTSINSGYLSIGNGGTSGSLASDEIANASQLIFNRSNNISYAGKLSGTGTLLKQGGGVLTLTGGASTQGNVEVQAGTLVFSQDSTQGATPFTVSGNYTTKTGAMTLIDKQNSTLVIGDTFTQEAGSTLRMTLGASPDITAKSASLAGNLIIDGFRFSNTPNLSSQITSQDYTVIRTTNGFLNNQGFDSVNGVTSSLDYLVAKGGIKNLDYVLGFELAWTASDLQKRTGNFTIASGSGFTVDQALGQMTSNNPAWSGNSLTKLGAGRLELKAVNTYTGLTSVQDGYLRTTVNNAIKESSGLEVLGTGNFNLESTQQEVQALNGNGSLSLRAGQLTVNTANGSTSTFSGVIDDGQRSGAQAPLTGGSLVKAGAGTLVLSGNNEYTGATRLESGTLQIGAGGTSGSLASGSLANAGTLVFNRSDDSSFNGALSGAGRLQKQGTGTLTLSNGSSTQGNVEVQAGILKFTQTQGVQGASVPFTVTGDYTTKANATTEIGDRNAVLRIGGTFTQEAGSNLRMTLGAEPDIMADKAELHGNLIFDGFSFTGGAPTLSSQVANRDYVVIRTTNGFVNNQGFDSVNMSGSGVDYLLTRGEIRNLDYVLGFSLAWTSADQDLRKGTFTLAANTGFTLDEALGDMAGNAGWTGDNLTKLGAGRLELKAVNTYTGLTSVQDGYLRTTVDNAIQTSSGLEVLNAGNFNLERTQQEIQSLNGNGSLSLRGGQLTVNTANGTTNTFNGIIDDGQRSGAQAALTGGSLIKAGAGTLVLGGANEFRGTTQVQAGTLQVGNGGTGGSLVGNLDNASRLIFNRSDNSSYGGELSGTGSLVKQGAGKLSLTATGNSSQGSVEVQAGSLSLEGGNLSTQGDYSTATGATTELGANSVLQVGGKLTQQASSTLNLVLGGNRPMITASSAELNGQLNVTGFTGNAGRTASTLVNTDFHLIHADGGIQGDFSPVLSNSYTNALDYVQLGGRKSADGKDYNLGLVLSWLSKPTQSHGTFSLNKDSFEVDLALADQAPSSTGWDGKTLTKNGNETLILSGDTLYTGNTYLNGGTLVFDGRNGGAHYTGNIIAKTGTTLNLLNGATLNGFIDPTKVLIDAASTWNMTADSQVESLTLAGQLNFATPPNPMTAGRTLTTTNLNGLGGVMTLYSRLLGNNSVTDRLVIGGQVTGTTTLDIKNAGGLGAQTSGDGIEVVSALKGATTTAQTSKDGFTLLNGHVDAGLYEYRLYAADAQGLGENWYLRSSSTASGDTISYRKEGAQVAAMASQLRQADTAMLGNLHNRLGDENSGSGQVAQDRRAWARMVYSDMDIRQDNITSSHSQGHLSGLQVGIDLLSDAEWRGGLYVGQLEGDINVNGNASGSYGKVGENNLRSRFLGGYLTWTGEDGLYVDSVLQVADHDYQIRPDGNAKASGDGNSLTASVEVGKPFALSDNLSLEPQAQLIYQKARLDDLSLEGTEVEQDSDGGFIGRVGLRLKGKTSTSLGELQAYGRTNLYYAESGTDVARFDFANTSSKVRSKTGYSSAELAGGLTLSLSPTTSVYAEVGKLYDLSGNTEVSSSLQGSVGLKLQWD